MKAAFTSVSNKKQFFTIMAFLMSSLTIAQPISKMIQNSLPRGSNKEVRQVNYRYKIIASPNKTWGYDIYAGKSVLIHQPSKPGMPGREGFLTKMQAEKVAQLVVSKIKRGEMPPTVTVAEMKKLRAID